MTDSMERVYGVKEFWNHTYSSRQFEQAVTRMNKISRALAGFAGETECATVSDSITQLGLTLIQREAFFTELRNEPRQFLTTALTDAQLSHFNLCFP